MVIDSGVGDSIVRGLWYSRALAGMPTGCRELSERGRNGFDGGDEARLARRGAFGRVTKR